MGLFTEKTLRLKRAAFAPGGPDPALEATLRGLPFDLLFVQNAWAIPMWLSLAVALVRLWRDRRHATGAVFAFAHPQRAEALLPPALAARLRARGHDAVLVVRHPGADEGDAYPERVQAGELGVPLVEVGHRVGPRRWAEEGVLMDVHQNADLVTYPGAYEGFGNALLESIYAQKPLWVAPHPAYVEDLRPLGFRLIETDDPIERVEAALTSDPAMAAELAPNQALAAAHFGERRLIGVLREALRETGQSATA